MFLLAQDTLKQKNYLGVVVILKTEICEELHVLLNVS